MIVAFIGVCIMIINDSITGTALGAIIGFISATGFALYTVKFVGSQEHLNLQQLF